MREAKTGREPFSWSISLKDNPCRYRRCRSEQQARRDRERVGGEPQGFFRLLAGNGVTVDLGSGVSRALFGQCLFNNAPSF
jgi:hypothetical protein